MTTASDVISCTGAILIGGKSSRMGSPKHLLRWRDGRTMLERVHDAVHAVCRNVVVIGGGELPPACCLERIADLRADAGPLGGIEALLASGVDHEYLICPCDLPLITGAALRQLLTPTQSIATIAQLADRIEPEPLPVRINARALPLATSMLDRGEGAVWKFMQNLQARIIPIDGRASHEFVNVNTPEAFHQWH